jgi:hypothetical protein
MRSKELDDAIVLLRRLAKSRNRRLVHNARLRTAQRELEMTRKGGKLDPRRIGRAIKEICTVLADEVLTTNMMR